MAPRPLWPARGVVRLRCVDSDQAWRAEAHSRQSHVIEGPDLAGSRATATRCTATTLHCAVAPPPAPPHGPAGGTMTVLLYSGRGSATEPLLSSPQATATRWQRQEVPRAARPPCRQGPPTESVERHISETSSLGTGLAPAAPRSAGAPPPDPGLAPSPENPGAGGLDGASHRIPETRARSALRPSGLRGCLRDLHRFREMVHSPRTEGSHSELLCNSTSACT